MTSKIKIVILQRGWIYVGRFSKLEEGMCQLEGAQCIRRWGTTKGLGELVNGPLASTKLDPVGIVQFHNLTMVASIDVKDEKWAKICD